MRKLLLFLTVTLIAWHYTVEGDNVGQEFITVDEDKCLINSTVREFFYKYHTKLRRTVALGHEYQGRKFQEQEMYGLIYDCNLERAARKKAIQSMHGSLRVPEGVGWIEFLGDYKGNLLDALQTALDELVKNEENSRKATTEKGSLVGGSDEAGIPQAKRKAVL
ncbi:hypothetical protein ANCCAN_21181 [Ancylostoma caninum]|uniref:Uncharacterized protein n=1 Tax=Ancylostoma caninum TaxID=29170 RepID=A0A368FLT5_ANCCA|nr:hypothetical protein ANCCAN_21181 [Ancylostoma caninum]